MVKVILAAVILGGTFGSASANVESVDDEVMLIDLSVEAMDASGSVVAHLTFDNEEELTLPLLDRGNGTYGIRTELEPKNYLVVFEIVGEESSEAVSLAELGVDLVDESGTATTDPDEVLSDETRGSLWLAVALGAASLSALAFWVLGGRKDEDEAMSAVSDEEE